MAITNDAQKVYDYLTQTVVPRGTVATYKEVHDATGVEFGVEGGYMGKVLGEIFHACDRRRLQPLTALVVKAGQGDAELYDKPRNRYGMPSSGYFVAISESENRAGRVQDEGCKRWGQKPVRAGFDKDASRWEHQTMVEAHQDSVRGRRSWPPTL